jgi:4-amino-4-deoxy-L-arabinose transferase-like glycosyltransferase
VALTAKTFGLPGWQTIFPSYGDYKLPVYIWLATVSLKLFGVSAWAYDCPAILGVASILLSGGLVKEFLKKYQPTWQVEALSLFTGLVVAISPWSIQFSRTAFEGHSGQFFLGLSVYFWLLGRRRPLWLGLSGLIGAVAVYCYYSVRFVWPLVLIALVLAEVYLARTEKKLTWLELIKQGLLWGLMPLIIFSLGFGHS